MLNCSTQHVRTLDLELAPVITVTPKGYKRRLYDLQTVLEFQKRRQETQARIEAQRYAADPLWFEKAAAHQLKRQQKRGR